MNETEALYYMVNQTSLALQGKLKRPFGRKRGFLSLSKEELVDVTLNYHSCVPGINLSVPIDQGTYGLADAIAWYRRKAEKGKNQETPVNAGYRIDPAGLKPDALFCTAEINQFKQRMQHEQEAAGIYQRIKAKADEKSLAEIEFAYDCYMSPEDCYEQLNQTMFLWSRSNGNINFKPPAKTRYARLKVILPREANEASGLGHVWLDDLEIREQKGGQVVIPNAGFERIGQNGFAESYDPVVWAGCPVIKMESRKPFCGQGDFSIYLENPTDRDEGGILLKEKLELVAGDFYTLYVTAKADGKLNRGLQVMFTFYDEQDQVLGDFVHSFNQKSYIRSKDYGLRMQCDALMYLLTGKKAYARKAKYEMLQMMDDFAQGAEYWMVKNERPEGDDSYGAVQAGRNMAVYAYTYQALKGAGVFSPKEREKFYALTEFIMTDLLDLRDRLELSLDEVQKGATNWQTDMCAGAALMMLVLEDFPNRAGWLNNAVYFLRGQLSHNLNPDGSWPESIRYHFAVLDHLCTFARAWQKASGENWFLQYGIDKMFAYGADIHMPGYEYLGNAIATPPFGDHRLDGDDFRAYGLYLEEIKAFNREVADKMLYCWQKANFPYLKFHGESIIFDFLRYPGEVQRERRAAAAFTSTAAYPDSGIYVLRHQYEGEKGSYCAIMSSPRYIGHSHRDQGSFMIVKDGVPVVMESQMEGYFDASRYFHNCSYSHACLLFAHDEHYHPARDGAINQIPTGTYSIDRGWADTLRTSEVKEVSLGAETEKIVIELKNMEGRGIHTRTFLHHIKEDVYEIIDRVEDFSGDVLFVLPLAAERVVTPSGQKEGLVVKGIGHYDVDVLVEFLSPVKEMNIEPGRTAPLYPAGQTVQYLQYVRARAAGATGFHVKIKPYKRMGQGGAAANGSEEGK